MPELPEIETIKHVIEPQITGLAIEKATVLRGGDVRKHLCERIGVV